MSQQQKYLKILAGIVPAGAVGASLLLGSAVPSRANDEPASLQPQAYQTAAVAERLAAIRRAVSDVVRSQSVKSGERDLRLAWGNWWRNWGWGYRPFWGWGWPNWNNWHNWHNWNNWWRNW